MKIRTTILMTAAALAPFAGTVRAASAGESGGGVPLATSARGALEYVVLHPLLLRAMMVVGAAAVALALVASWIGLRSLLRLFQDADAIGERTLRAELDRSGEARPASSRVQS